MPAPLRNESGFVLVIAMLIMVVLTVVGIAALNSSTIELRISGNDRVAKRNFYDAESAAFEAGARLEAEGNVNELVAARSSKLWLQAPSGGQDPVLNAANTWQNPGFNNFIVASVAAGNQVVRLAAVDHGIARGARGSSLRMTASAVHDYHLFGYAQLNNSWKLIEIGYKKRF